MAHKLMALFMGSLAAASLQAGTTLYWTGAAEAGQTPANFFTVGNWATADGSAAHAAPAAGDTVVFTNETALSLTTTKDLPSYTWRFEGPGDVLGPGNTTSKKAYNFSAGSCVTATGGGTYKLDYSVNLDKNMGDFIVTASEGSTMGLSTYGTMTINSGARVIKRGPGTERHDRIAMKSGASFCLEEGALAFNRGYGAGWDANSRFEIAGPAAKTIGCENDDELTIRNYSETEEARGTLSFYVNRNVDRVVTFKGAAGTTTKCSADIYNGNKDKTYTLVWDPGNDATLELVGRVHNRATGKLYVKSGKMRLAEDAGIQNLKELRIGTGTTFEVDKANTGSLRGGIVVIEEGATLKIDGNMKDTWPQGSSCPSDVVMEQFAWNGEIEICGTRRLYHYFSGTDKTTYGENAALKFSGGVTNRYHVYSARKVTLGKYTEAPESEGKTLITCYTAKDNQLTIRGNEDTRFTADIYNQAMGTFELVWDPRDVTKKLTVAKRTYANSRPRFRVKAGTMRFAESANLRNTDSAVTIEAGATFEIGADAPNALGNAAVTLADETAKIVVEPGLAFVRSLTVGGKSIEAGFYSADTLPEALDGTGTLCVGMSGEGETVAATWTGGGETTSITDPANWGGVLPNLQDASLVATIPAGATVSIPGGTTARVKGLVLNPGVKITGSQYLIVGSQGITVPDAAETATVEIDTPLHLTAAQTWSVGAKAVLRLAENATLSSVSSSEPTFLTLSGSIEFHGNGSNLFGDTCVLKGATSLYADNALGGAGQTVTVEKNGSLGLCGCTLDCQILTKSPSGTDPLLRSQAGVNRLRGLHQFDDPNMAVFGALSASELHFCGGMLRANPTGVGNNGGSYSPHNDMAFRVWIEETPVQLEKTMLGCDAKGAVGRTTEFHLDVAGNSFYRGLILRYNVTQGNVLYTGVPNAFADDGLTGVSFAADATKSVWDMQGNDQLVASCFSRCRGARVTSQTAATLHLKDNALNYRKLTERDNGNMLWSIQGTASQVDAATYAGLTTLSKEGSLTHYLIGESTSAGAVKVANGRLVFMNESATPLTLPQTVSGLKGPEASGFTFTPTKGSWRNASEAVVTGGTLELQHGSVFGKQTVVKVSDAGRIELADGVSQRCYGLTINGVPCALGTWGGPESAAENKDEHFTGRGVLRVAGDGLGLMIFAR